MLDLPGYEVDTAADGRQALNTVQQAACDIILMGCHMPGMDGLKATTGVREFERQLAEHRPGRGRDAADLPNRFHALRCRVGAVTVVA